MEETERNDQTTTPPDETHEAASPPGSTASTISPTSATRSNSSPPKKERGGAGAETRAGSRVTSLVTRTPPVVATTSATGRIIHLNQRSRLRRRGCSKPTAPADGGVYSPVVRAAPAAVASPPPAGIDPTGPTLFSRTVSTYSASPSPRR